jgi:hypothetical protein
MDRAFTLVVLTVLAASVAAVASVPQPEIQSWDAVPKYEIALEANPEDVQARRLLLAWYTRNYQDPKSNPARLTHILWAIQNKPEMQLSDSRSLQIDERDVDSFPRIRAAWLEQVQKHPSHPVVLLRAATALMHSDRDLAANWLKSVLTKADEVNARERPTFPPRVESATEWNWPFIASEAKRTLAQLYTDAIIGVVARTPWEGTGPIDKNVSGSDFARMARQEIADSKDGWFVAQSAWLLHLTSESFERDGRKETNYAPLAWEWFQKAEHLPGSATSLNAYLGPFQRYWSTRLPGVIPPPVQRITRSGADAPKPLATVPAVCPPDAHYPDQGTVVNVKLVIARDGAVRFALLQGGSPAAIEPALAAARQWRFAPGYDGSVPVEVETSITIPVCVKAAEEKP